GEGGGFQSADPPHLAHGTASIARGRHRHPALTCMAVRIVRLGTPRAPGEGVRLGTVRRPPRGVPKREFASRDFYDVWLPELAPSAPLLTRATSQPWTDARWRRFARQYAAEMKKAPAQHVMQTLAALSHSTSFAVGCYCEDESRCHRTLLRDLLREAGAEVTA